MTLKNKKILAVSIVVIVIAVSLIMVYSQNFFSSWDGGRLSRVACLGDSITNMTGYPGDLQALLGDNSVVRNYGVIGATVNLNTDAPYYYEPSFHNAMLFLPTTVIIMLGTNDARTNVYTEINDFVADYERIITRVQGLSSKPQIFLVEPPPIFNNTLDLNGTSFAQGVIPRIQEVASKLGLPVIDVYTPLLSHPEYFPDGVHPNSEGAQIIANTIYKAINSNST